MASIKAFATSALSFLGWSAATYAQLKEGISFALLLITFIGAILGLYWSIKDRLKKR